MMIKIRTEIVKDELGLTFWEVQIEGNPPVQHANKTQAMILAIGQDEEINHRRLSIDDFKLHPGVARNPPSDPKDNPVA